MFRSFALAALVASMGCGPSLDRSRPMSVTYRDDLGTDLTRVIVEDAMTQLRIEEGPGQTLVIKKMECDGYRLGGVSWDEPRTIKVCPDQDPVALEWTIKHEFLHALGVYEHLDCERGGVMVPKLECYRGASPHILYLDADLNLLGAN